MSTHRSLRLPALVAGCAGLLLAATSASHAEGPELPEGLTSFLQSVQSSARTGDPSLLTPLVHPTSRACATGDPHFAARTTKQAERLFGHKTAVRELTWRPTDAARLADAKKRMTERSGATFPVDPEGALQVTWDAPVNSARAANLLVARVDRTWFWVLACKG